MGLHRGHVARLLGNAIECNLSKTGPLDIFVFRVDAAMIFFVFRVDAVIVFKDDNVGVDGIRIGSKFFKDAFT